MRPLPLALIVLPLLLGCASRRVLTLENGLLLQENAALQDRVHALERSMPPQGAWVRSPTLDDLSAYLERAGYRATRTAQGSAIRLDHVGRNHAFGVNIQVFEGARVVLLSTTDYLHLEIASNPESLVLLLVQLAALNYELLVGKLQLDVESGQVLMSVELPVTDGLGYETFRAALEQLLHSADTRHPELVKAAAGLGL